MVLLLTSAVLILPRGAVKEPFGIAACERKNDGLTKFATSRSFSLVLHAHLETRPLT